MEKRTIIAVILSIVVMYGYSLLVKPVPRNVAVQTPQPVQQQISAVQPLTVMTVKQVSQPLPAVSAGAKDVVVETDLYTAVFSTYGASLKKLVLKKYATSTAPNAKKIALMDENSPENYTLQTVGNGLPIDQSAVYSVNTDNLPVKKEKRKAWNSSPPHAPVIT